MLYEEQEWGKTLWEVQNKQQIWETHLCHYWEILAKGQSREIPLWWRSCSSTPALLDCCQRHFPAPWYSLRKIQSVWNCKNFFLSQYLTYINTQLTAVGNQALVCEPVVQVNEIIAVVLEKTLTCKFCHCRSRWKADWAALSRYQRQNCNRDILIYSHEKSTGSRKH